jgi:hypothetical protein
MTSCWNLITGLAASHVESFSTPPEPDPAPFTHPDPAVWGSTYRYDPAVRRPYAGIIS